MFSFRSVFILHLVPWKQASEIGVIAIDYSRLRSEKQSFLHKCVKKCQIGIDKRDLSPIMGGNDRRNLSPEGATPMDVILGIDIGGSTTKIVGLRTDGSVISMLRVRAEDQVTSCTALWATISPAMA